MRLSILAFLVLLIVCLVSDPTNSGQTRGGIHQSAASCDLCHPNAQGEGVSLPGDTNSFCLGCHKAIRLLSHPVNIIPDRPLPAQLPLREGKIFCLTCHYYHEGKGVSHLRSPLKNLEPCSPCHLFGGDEWNGMVHANNIGIAHWLGKVSGEGLIQERPSAIDRVSILCLGCHDATFGPSVGIELGGSKDRGRGLRLSHPIGVDYRDSFYAGRGFLKDPADLNPLIKLFDGKVGCGSCHSIYSRDKYSLVISNKRGELCKVCHNM